VSEVVKKLKIDWTAAYRMWQRQIDLREEGRSAPSRFRPEDGRECTHPQVNRVLKPESARSQLKTS
jgi:hypothetical protein